MTTNGGESWHLQQGLKVETLSVADGDVYRVAYDHSGCPGPCQPTLQMSTPGATTWKTLVARLEYPGRSSSAQIVSSGSELLVAMYGSQAGPVSAQAVVYWSDDKGASWLKMADPCDGKGPGIRGHEEDLVDLASAPGGYFAGLCSPHTGSATFEVSSSDGGQHWSFAGTLPKSQGLGLIAAASSTDLAIATSSTLGGGAFTARLLTSSDGGRKWTTAETDVQQLNAKTAIPAWLGFETPKVGRWISSSNKIWSIADAGQHWSPLAFP